MNYWFHLISELKCFRFGVLIVLLIFSGVSDGIAQEKAISAGLEGLKSIESINNRASVIMDSIDKYYKKVAESGAYQTLIDGQNLKLPYAILGKPKDKKEQNDQVEKNYMIIVNKINLDPVRGMTAEISMKLMLETGKFLYFMADNVPLSKSGKLRGEMSLFLVKTDSISVGQGYKVVFKGMDNPNKAYSYVTFDCRGFKKIYLNGQLKFNQNAVVEYNEKGEKAKRPFKLDFFVSANKLSNLVISLYNIPPFEFARLPGFKCTIDTLVLDKSDIENAPGFSLPKWYLDSLQKKVPGLDPGLYSSRLWEGVYIPSIKMIIPRSMSEGAPKEITPVSVRSIIVDANGITALASAGNILGNSEGEGDGDMKGFKYHIDSLRINVIANTLSRAGFYGGMSFPVCKQNSKVAFGLTLSRNMKDDSELNYDGYGLLKANLNMNAFGMAQLGLTNLRLDFQYRDKQFFPKATIDGSIIIAVTKKNDDPAAKPDSTPAGNFGVEFGGLVVSSEAPYIGQAKDFFMRIKTGDLSSKMAGLPVTIKDPIFKFENGNQRFGLGLTLGIHLTKSSGNSSESSSGFGGEATFFIWTKRNASTKKWGYDDFQLTAINIGADLGAVKLQGSLEMFNNDLVYGKGYCGNLSLDIIDKIKVEGAAIFGRKSTVAEPLTKEVENLLADGGELKFPSSDEDTKAPSATMYRYWFLDARVSFTPGIPIGTGIEINSFTGGIYYNMAMVPPNMEGKKPTTVECKTVSGRTYNPEKGVGGLLAGIGLQSMGGGNVFNGDINFGIEFNLNGMGVLRLATWGGVNFITMNFSPSGVEAVASKMSPKGLGENTETETRASEPPKSSIAASWFVQYDVPNKTLQGDFDIYMNLAGVIKGNQGGNKAGRISIYASGTEKKWYLYVGKPIEGEMIGVNVAGLADIGGYFCVGSVLPIPPIAPMPPEIGKVVDIDYDLLAMGGGMSLGSRLKVQGFAGADIPLCNLKVGFDFLLLSGFDLLIAQSTLPVYCKGSGERGINRWYSTGQAYLYGDVSLKASYSCFISGSVNLMTLYIKAYVFAQLPKPTYLTGGLEVGFRIKRLGSFKKRINIEIGEICASNTLETAVNFISAIDPASDQKDVPVGTPIRVFFSNPIETFTYSIKTGDNPNTIYRAHIVEDSIKVSTPKGKVNVELDLSTDGDQLTIRPLNVLPENTLITVTAKVVTQYRTPDGWVNVKGAAETKTVTFTTAAEQNKIPVTDIYYSYPLPDMKNFYKNESRTGYVRLSVLPNKAVKLAPGYEFNIGVYKNGQEVDRSNQIQYKAVSGENNFTFEIPTMNLDNNITYTLKIMKSPVGDASKESYTKNNNVSVGTIESVKPDTVILEYNFTTSSSQTFIAKMGSLNTTYSEVFDGVIAAELSLNKAPKGTGSKIEALSEPEMKGFINKGVQVCDPLVQFGAIQYDKASIDQLEAIIKQIPAVGAKISNNTNGSAYTTVNSMLSDLNDYLTNVNMECLIKGECSSDQIRKFTIPKGTFTLPIGYYLPGADTPNHVFNISIKLDKDLILPK